MDDDTLNEFPNQRAMAEALAEDLVECGHDDISSLDLLDCLATVGLKLAPLDASDFEPSGISTPARAYLDELATE